MSYGRKINPGGYPVVSPVSRGVVSFDLVSGNHTPGTFDTYRMTFSDGGFVDVQIWNGANGSGGGGGGGTVTGATNTGTGIGIYTSLVGGNLQFKSLRNNGGLTISNTATEIMLSLQGMNTGTGASVFKDIVAGGAARFRKLKGVGVTITENADDITFTAAAGSGQFLSVEDFGATGDGVTNDAAAFQAALDAARTQKKGLLVPDGRYVITGLAAQSGRVILLGTGQSVLLGTFHYHEPSFPVSASTLTPLTPDSPFFSATGMSFQSTDANYALWLSSVWQGSFITTFSLAHCKFYGQNGLLLQHMGGFDMLDCEFNNVLVGAQYEGCVNGNMVQCRFQNQAVAGARIRRNGAEPQRKGGENMRFTNCEFDVCSHGLAVEEHQWLIVESCLFDYCALPVFLLGSWYAKIEKSYVGVSNVPRSTFASVPGAIFPDANGIALYGLCNVPEGQPVSVTAVNCEFVNYIAGTNQPIVYVNGYGNSGQPQMGYETTFDDCLFYYPEVHSAPRILDIAYCRVARVTNNRFSSYNRSSTLEDAYSTSNCQDYMNFGNSFLLCTQSDVVVGSKYEKAVGARQDASDPGPIGADGLWSQNGTGPLQIRNKTNTGWNTPGTVIGSAATKIVVAGDSHTARQGILSPAWPSMLEDMLNSSGANVQVFNLAINGWSYYNANTVASFGSQTMVQKIISLAPDILHVHLGFNDANKINPRTLAQIQADAATFYNTIRAALPNCKIFYGSDVSHDTTHAGATIYNKQVMPFAFQLKNSGILANCYTSEMLEDPVASSTQTNLQDFNSLTAYIKALSAVTAYYDVPLWRIARLGCTGYDGLHFTSFGTQLIAGAVRQAYISNATMAAALPSMSNQNYASFNDPNYLFTLTFSDISGNWVEQAPSVTREHPTHQAGPMRYCPSTVWYMPSKGSLIINKSTLTTGATDLFSWAVYNTTPNTAISVSTDGAAFVATGQSTDQQGKYSDTGNLSAYAVGSHVFRYKIGNEIHGPATLTLSAGSALPAAPESWQTSGFSTGVGRSTVNNTKQFFYPGAAVSANTSLLQDATQSNNRRVRILAAANGRTATLHVSAVVDTITPTTTHVLLGLNLYVGAGAGTYAGSFVLQSGYCNVNNFALALCGSLVQKMVGNEVQYEPWVMTAGGTGVILDTTPNGATALFSCILS